MTVGPEANLACTSVSSHRADRSVYAPMCSENPLPRPGSEIEEFSAMFSLFTSQTQSSLAVQRIVDLVVARVCGA